MTYLEPKIPFEQSPNYNVGTGEYAKIGYVLHATLGKFVGAKETLKASKRLDAAGNDLGRASSHLLISEKDHEWIELVKFSDVAWHAGNVSSPDSIGRAALLTDTRGNYINPNKYLLGIEICCGWDVNKNGKVDIAELDISDWQVEAAAQYMARNELLHGIAIDAKRIVGHTNLCSYKSDNMYRHTSKIVDRAIQIVKSARTPDPVVAPQQPVCIPAADVAAIKTQIANKEVNGLYQRLKNFFK